MQVQTTPTLSIDELRRAIPLIAPELTIVIQSEPGCGKTSLLSMIAEDMGDTWRSPRDTTYYPDDKYDYIYIDCPVKDMQDIGMVVPNHETQALEYYVASLFKLRGPSAKRPKVILLDELLKAPKLMQIIYTRLMLERMAGDESLPLGSMIIATSNNATDGVGDTMLAHAGNRVCRVEMRKPDSQSWLPWATKNNIHRVIRTFVTMFPKCLASYRDPGQDTNGYIFKPNSGVLSFCSPRSLAKSDPIVRNRDVLGDNTTFAMLAGTIGATAAGDMTALMALERSIVQTEDIVKNPEIDVPQDHSAQLMILFQAVDVLETQDELTRFMRWVNRIPSDEVKAVFFNQMCRVPRAIKLAAHNEELRKFAMHNQLLLSR